MVQSAQVYVPRRDGDGVGGREVTNQVGKGCRMGRLVGEVVEQVRKTRHEIL
jgi:hypothetical protein